MTILNNDNNSNNNSNDDGNKLNINKLNTVMLQSELG